MGLAPSLSWRRDADITPPGAEDERVGLAPTYAGGKSSNDHLLEQKKSVRLVLEMLETRREFGPVLGREESRELGLF